mgnify:CR=1 FL=1
MSFQTLGLTPALVRAVREQGYHAPTAIQSAAIPAILGGGDVLGLALAATLNAPVEEGSFGVFRDFPGYVKTVELSVYVAPTAQRRGIGRAVLGELEARARAKGLAAMVGGIDSANGASIALHEQLGFEVQGNLKGVGRKFGKSLDLVFMVKAL